jgi:hypothetical protein
MASDANSFRLSVWRPATLSRRVSVFEPSQQASLPGDGSQHLHLYEEIYSWAPEEDVWLSICESADQRRLNSLLVEAFSPDRAPSERGIAALPGALSALRETILSPGKTDWADCRESVQNDEDQRTNYRANSMIALYNHLSWVHEVFKNVPGASITIR